MSLQFDQVYLLNNPGGNFLDAEMIALGIRTRRVIDRSGTDREALQFLVNSEPHGGHQIVGMVVDERSDGVVVVEDLEKLGDDFKPVFWRFEPLTLEAWRRLGEAGSIGGYEDLREALTSTEEVRQFYRDQYLDEDTWSP